MTLGAVETLVEAKARGGFYTPPPIASFIADWAIMQKDARVLEPSCGDGAFLLAASERLVALGASSADTLIGVEKSVPEAAKAAALVPGAHIRRASFFDVEPEGLGGGFDAVIGNPPYIRYHGFTGDDRTKGLARARAQGVHLTRLASSWAHFVVHAASFLTAQGRLGLVLPAELLVTDYAQPIRNYLLDRFASVVVIAFDRMVFQDAQVDAVLLLASNDGPSGMSIVRLTDASDLASFDLSAVASRAQPGPRWSTALDVGAADTYRDLVTSTRAERLSAVASVDIGVVTGANAFFILTPQQAEAVGLPARYLAHVVQRPKDVPGLTVRPAETARLLLIPSSETPVGEAVERYLQTGVESGVPTRYKCRVRRSWFSVPLPRKRPHAFLPYMTGDVPRLIINATESWSTNLLHGVTFRHDAPDPRAVSAAMLSSVTLLSAEVEGRPYGGGVLKLETAEAERLLIPVLSAQQVGSLVRLHPELDRLMREGGIDAASSLVDGVLGIDPKPLVAARMVFRKRRLERRIAEPSSRGIVISLPVSSSDPDDRSGPEQRPS